MSTTFAPMIAEYGSMVAVAVAYSLLAYSSKWLKDGDTFLPKKFLRTVVIGLIVGVVAAETGTALSLGTVEQLSSAVGAVHLSEIIVNALWGSYVRFRDREVED